MGAYALDICPESEWNYESLGRITVDTDPGVSHYSVINAFMDAYPDWRLVYQVKTPYYEFRAYYDSYADAVESNPCAHSITYLWAESDVNGQKFYKNINMTIFQT